MGFAEMLSVVGVPRASVLERVVLRPASICGLVAWLAYVLGQMPQLWAMVILLLLLAVRLAQRPLSLLPLLLQVVSRCEIF